MIPRFMFKGLSRSCTCRNELFICGRPLVKTMAHAASIDEKLMSKDLVKENEIQVNGQLLEKILSIVKKENLVTNVDGSEKVVEFKHPEELQNLLKLDISASGRIWESVTSFFETVVRYSVRTGHPHFHNQLYAGIDEVALAGSWLTEALNTNQHTYEVAPVFTLVEHYVISRLVDLFGWKEGDGIFSPGGSMSNTYGMVLARYQRHPQIKTCGTTNMKPLVALTSDQSHYSIQKAAAWLGLGMNNVVAVPTDSYGRMLPEALREAIKTSREKGGEPFFVNATSGTTVFGAFDPLDTIADVCSEEGLWMHVDACWGGTAILSRTHRHHLHGIHRADSIAWNPHKMLGAPLQCSPFIVRHKGLLHECNSASATYLFQQDKFYDVTYDTGDKSFQCGRKVDAFKLYLLLHTHGLEEMERKIDAAFNASRYLNDQIKVRPGFRPVLDNPQCTNVCFWYIPPSLRHQAESLEWWQKLSKVAPYLKERMVKSGEMMIGYQPVPNKNLVNFIRMINCCYPPPTEAHMDYILDKIETYGADL